jgi:NitT/TauT family transport system permease protein
MFLAVVILGLGIAVRDLIQMLEGPLPPGIMQIPVDVLFSLGRLAFAYGASLLWTLPVAAWIVGTRRASRFVTPLVEVVASVPATALVPVIISFSIFIVAGLGAESQLAAFIIALLAIQWYLLFNLIAGMRSIPGDLEEAAKVFGLHGWAYWRRLLLPAVMPSLLIGSISAWGAGWNSLIVAEYLQYGSYPPFTTPGIGYLIYRATWIDQNNAELLLCVLALSAVVFALNKLLWRPLIHWASKRYRFDI